MKIGQVGRALSIFRVNRVFVYDDDDREVEDQKKEANIIGLLLRYMDTPQYLRKTLFPYNEELRYVGLLPPLRTPHHPLLNERDEEGDCREATVLESGEGKSSLELGLPETGILEEELEEGNRVTVELGERLNEDKRLVHLIDEKDIDDYWGFEVVKVDNLAQSLSNTKSDCFIGTSRRGQNLYEVVEGIKTNNVNNMAVVFGGPYQGLFEICEKQGIDFENKFDAIVNAVPGQGTETVRTEEALLATLAILNILLRRK